MSSDDLDEMDVLIEYIRSAAARNTVAGLFEVYQRFKHIRLRIDGVKE